MKRYLVVFIDEDGVFQCGAVQAKTVSEALIAFIGTGLAYDEIYSVTRAA